MNITIDEENAPLKRLDKALSNMVEELSRARIQNLIQGGYVLLNGTEQTNPSAKIKLGDVITLEQPPLVESTPQPENIPLDIVYEDEHMLVINKQAGLVVHPGAGNPNGTLVNALLHHCRDSLSGIGGVMRPGIVHRLDKDTSGLMVVAKHDRAHQGLADQLQTRSLSREYLALTVKIPTPPKGTIEGAIGRDPRSRQKMAMRVRGGKDACTHYQIEKRFGVAAALVRCKLESGRTHQIRVHMTQGLGHPLIGDPLYGAPKTALQSALRKAGLMQESIDHVCAFPRQALHAQRIGFVHPVTGDGHSYEAAVPKDMAQLIERLQKCL